MCCVTYYYAECRVFIVMLCVHYVALLIVMLVVVSPYLSIIMLSVVLLNVILGADSLFCYTECHYVTCYATFSYVGCQVVILLC